MPPPRIIEHPMDVTVPVTQTAVFVCVGQGYGLVDVNWRRIKRGQSRERPPPDKSTVATMVTPDNITTITSMLTIPDVADGNRGDYWCVYSNNINETRSNIVQLAIGSKCYLCS